MEGDIFFLTALWSIVWTVLCQSLCLFAQSKGVINQQIIEANRRSRSGTKAMFDDERRERRKEIKALRDGLLQRNASDGRNATDSEDIFEDSANEEEQCAPSGTSGMALPSYDPRAWFITIVKVPSYSAMCLVCLHCVAEFKLQSRPPSSIHPPIASQIAKLRSLIKGGHAQCIFFAGSAVLMFLQDLLCCPFSCYLPPSPITYFC